MSNDKHIRDNVLQLWKKGEKQRTIKIKGTSMKPLIEEGNSITFCPLPDMNNLTIGDIAVFQRGLGLIAHRIVGKTRADNGFFFMEKGDNTFYPQAVSGNDILGMVIKINTDECSIDLTTWYWIAINRLLGYYWRTLFLVLSLFLKVKKSLFGAKQLYVSSAYKKTLQFFVKLPTFFLRLK
ncbi:MAG: S24/S26 family peptidase [Pseudomonadota bacterium]